MSVGRSIRKITGNLDFAARLAGAHLLKKRYPLSVTFISTYRCNFTCDYCDVWRFKEKEMTTNEVLSMIDEFVEMGLKRFSFNGGEPLLRDDLGELISYCRGKGVFTTMFTNGSLVTRNIEKLKNLDILVVSLDGPREVHEGQRMKGVYDSVIGGILSAKAAGLNVWTNTVITKENIGCIEAMVEEARKLGVRMIFQPVLHYPHSSDAATVKGLSPGEAEYRALIKRLKELKRQGAPIMHSLQYLDYISVPVWSRNRRKCWAGELYCAVTPTGEVSPCYPLFNSKKWPNGLELGFRNAFLELGRQVNCTGCYCALVESDFLYSLRISAVINLLKSLEAV